ARKPSSPRSVTRDRASPDVAVEFGSAPLVTGTGSVGGGGTSVPLVPWQVPVFAGVSWLGPQRKKSTVPVGLGAVPPVEVWPVTVAVSVIGVVSVFLVVVRTGAVVIVTEHSPSLPRA